MNEQQNHMISEQKKIFKLGELKKGIQAKIIKTGDFDSSTHFVNRLLDMGFLEGSVVEVIHEAPWGKDPIAIRIRGGIIAMRRVEANAIEVEVL